MIFHKRKKNHDKQRTFWRKSKILIFDERKKCLDIVIVKQRRRKKNPYLVKTISWRNLGSKAPRGVRAFYGLVETKLITRRGCGDSVSTPSADEGRLFIKSHVSRVPRRPINSPWRFLLWPPTDLIHISSADPPPPRVFSLPSKHSQYLDGSSNTMPFRPILDLSWSPSRRLQHFVRV